MSVQPRPIGDPQAMAEELDMLEAQCDVMAVRLARIETANQERVPAAIVDRLAGGESPVAVWRAYRGMTTDELAQKVGLPPHVIATLETPGQRVVPPTLERMAPIAAALGVDLDDLLPWPQDDES